jgi:hypothetical protein
MKLPLYFMTSCMVLDYPDRNFRNEEVRTHETSPYFMASDWSEDCPDRNCRIEAVRTHETSPYTS